MDMMRSPPYQHRPVGTMTILIVDDAELIRAMLIDYLADAGYTAVGASDGRETLEYLHIWPCQLVFLDIMMPVMDGWELLQVIHADLSLATIPVVVMTAAENVRTLALEQGAMEYLPKPVNVDIVMTIVRYHLGT